MSDAMDMIAELRKAQVCAEVAETALRNIMQVHMLDNDGCGTFNAEIRELEIIAEEAIVRISHIKNPKAPEAIKWVEYDGTGITLPPLNTHVLVQSDNGYHVGYRILVTSTNLIDDSGRCVFNFGHEKGKFRWTEIAIDAKESKT